MVNFANKENDFSGLVHDTVFPLRLPMKFSYDLTSITCYGTIRPTLKQVMSYRKYINITSMYIHTYTHIYVSIYMYFTFSSQV